MSLIAASLLLLSSVGMGLIPRSPMLPGEQISTKRVGMIGVRQYRQISAGPAAHYAPGFDDGVGWDWPDIYNLQASWGNAVGPPAQGNRWCVHADIDVVGQTLLLVSDGVSIYCTTGDTVQAAHKAQWRARWGIELSWSLWNELPNPGWVEVYRR